MGRYWSLEDCCWVDYSTVTTEPAMTSGAELEPAIAGQVPEQPTPAPQQAPSPV